MTTKIGTYRLMALLQYGRHKWLERTGPTIRLPNAILGRHLRTRANKLRDQFYELENMGIITHLRWNQYWTTVELTPPVNMSHNVGETIDVG
jgi:hypothetical protein